MIPEIFKISSIYPKDQPLCKINLFTPFHHPISLPVFDNDDRVDIEINVTNCADDDAPDSTRNDDFAVRSSFNYRPSVACDHNLIDLMNEGDNYVSNNCNVPLSGSDLHLVCPTITTTIFAEGFDSEFIRAMATLNSSEQFNYERDKIVEITNETEYLCKADEKFSNNDCEIIFGNSGDDVEYGTKSEIRFKEHDRDDCVTERQPGGLPQLHPSDAGCDELDNCFSRSKFGGVERG